MAFDSFESRHLGPREEELALMLSKIGVASLNELINKTVPEKNSIKETFKNI